MRYMGVDSFAQAVDLLGSEQGKSMVLAGGTDVLVQLKLELAEPDLLINIKAIPGVKDIAISGDKCRIGVAVSGAELGENAGLLAEWPGVVEAMELIGSTQVQGRATMAGNLCNASPAADAVPALVAAGAWVETLGPAGAREIAVKDVPVSPGKTCLAKDEIVTSICLPRQQTNSGDAYLRFIPRTEMDIAVASAAVNLTLNVDGTIKSANVSLGAVAPTVLLVAEAGKVLVGNRLDSATLDQLSTVCAAACNPIDDRRGTAEFRRKIAGVLAGRAAKTAYQRAGGSL